MHYSHLIPPLCVCVCIPPTCQHVLCVYIFILLYKALIFVMLLTQVCVVLHKDTEGFFISTRVFCRQKNLWALCVCVLPDSVSALQKSRLLRVGKMCMCVWGTVCEAVMLTLTVPRDYLWSSDPRHAEDSRAEQSIPRFSDTAAVQMCSSSLPWQVVKWRTHGLEGGRVHAQEESWSVESPMSSSAKHNEQCVTLSTYYCKPFSYFLISHVVH